MKTNLFVLVLLSLLSFNGIAQEKTKKELKAEKQQQKQKEIEAIVNSKDFVFEAQKVIPQGGRLLNLDYNTYFLKFNEVKTTGDLPFFGRAFNVAYGGDGGIKFKGVPKNVKLEEKKKGYTIIATVKGNNDVYNLMFYVFFDGSATLSINSNNRAPISYNGEISAPRADKR